MNNLSLPPPNYPLDSFLTLTRNAAHELEQNIQAPDAMIGMALISAMTTACQGLIDVKLPTGRIRPVTQNVMVIAESGERKSTVDSLVFSAIRDADAQEVVAHEAQFDSYQVELDWWRTVNNEIRKEYGGERDTLKAKMHEHATKKPMRPKLRIRVREDITPEAIKRALKGDGQSMLLATDEGGVLLKGAAMKNLSLMNRLWDSPTTFPLDRVDEKDDHERITNPRVSVSIMTQSVVLQEYLAKHGSAAKGSGHLARYLVGWPRSTRGYRGIVHGELVWEHLPRFQARVKDILKAHQVAVDCGRVEREVLEFSDDARERWYQLSGDTEWMQRPGGYFEGMGDFASKAMEIHARLAAVFHYFSGEQGKITLDTVERALNFVNWHAGEARRLFLPATEQAEDQADAESLVRYLRQKVWAGMVGTSWIRKTTLMKNTHMKKDRFDVAVSLLINRGAVWIGTVAPSRTQYLNLVNTFFATV